MLSTREILAISMLKGIGRKTVQKLLPLSERRLNESEDIFDLLVRAGSSGLRATPPTQSEVRQAQARADNAISLAQSKGISIFGFNEESFPPRLKKMPDPPVILYSKGDVSCLTEKLSIAVIGTRNPSALGLDLARRYSAHLSSKGAVIISGLALGIDSAAHSACIDRGGRTVAVLAHGLDMVYPSSNTHLSDEIVQSGGCLISEYPPGIRPQKQSFVERDRIQSGLSDGVLVIQTGVSGGTMHTVRFAKGQGRPVLVARFEDIVHDGQTDGNRQLLESGEVRPVESEVDLDAFLQIVSRPIEAMNSPEDDEEDLTDRMHGQMNLFD